MAHPTFVPICLDLEAFSFASEVRRDLIPPLRNVAALIHYGMSVNDDAGEVSMLIIRNPTYGHSEGKIIIPVFLFSSLLCIVWQRRN